jgi:hypothetical protein
MDSTIFSLTSFFLLDETPRMGWKAKRLAENENGFQSESDALKPT